MLNLVSWECVAVVPAIKSLRFLGNSAGRAMGGGSITL
ncbi:hypothetical protein Y88_1776 [Novosphingobium nitrogenifigens DSM 19370]|uniref:Uncharacterized protein n=1 Tax=Novosphingobium nitrogenifigens DSM 19370 TaxID=983920 RepID=F1Z3Y0_9SPHN|nr:hypothetical protein Y88_1776 [Novosphingobium nitrogenifigens DSM 19370]